MKYLLTVVVALALLGAGSSLAQSGPQGWQNRSGSAPGADELRQRPGIAPGAPEWRQRPGVPPGAPEWRQRPGGPESMRPSAPQYVRNPAWRFPGRGGSDHPRFRFRGHTFVVIGAPLFAAPWLYYPYAMTPAWGAGFYVPNEPGYFLYYCPNPAGYYPEVTECPAGWWPTVPDEPSE